MSLLHVLGQLTKHSLLNFMVFRFCSYVSILCFVSIFQWMDAGQAGVLGAVVPPHVGQALKLNTELVQTLVHAMAEVGVVVQAHTGQVAVYHAQASFIV